MVEQRYQAVLQVLDGIPVTEVAERFGVARQTVHRWVARYRDNGIDDLSLGDHMISVGLPLAGQRVTLRLDGPVAHVLSGGVLARTIACPVPPEARSRLRGARAEPPSHHTCPNRSR